MDFLSFGEPFDLLSFGEPLDFLSSVDFFLYVFFDLGCSGDVEEDTLLGDLLGEASFFGCGSFSIRRFLGTGEPGDRLHSRESTEDTSESSSSNCSGSMKVLLAENVTDRRTDDRFTDRSGVKRILRGL